MKQPQPGLLFTVNKVKERNTALGSAACPSVRLKGCMMGSSNKERCQERHGICKKTTTLQNDLFIPYLMVFVLSLVLMKAVGSGGRHCGHGRIWGFRCW